MNEWMTAFCLGAAARASREEISRAVGRLLLPERPCRRAVETGQGKDREALGGEGNGRGGLVSERESTKAGVEKSMPYLAGDGLVFVRHIAI